MSMLGVVFGLVGLILLVQPSPAAESDGDEVVLVEPGGKWHVRVPGQADYTFWYGRMGDVPLLGDWNGDGWDTPGMYRPSNGFVYLTNDLPPNGGVGFGDPSLTFFFGMAGDQVVVGDWDGNGTDTLGIRRDGRMYLINRNATGVADVDFWFGVPADTGFGGDADGNGTDSVFLYRASNSFVYYTNTMPSENGGVTNTAGEFFFGLPSDRFVIGDWDGDGDDTVGVYRPGERRVYLRNTLNTGPADIAYVWGAASWVPVAGHVNLTAGPPPTTTTTTLPPPSSLPIRVNAGGPEIPSSDGHPWQQDTTANPSPFVNSNSGDPHNTTTAWPTPSLDNSVPAGTPPGVFATERYDEAGGPNMHWNFPVDTGQWVEVRLYFANGYPGAGDNAERLFDVTIDDWLVLDDYDIVADVGHQAGVMKRFVVKADADGLDIHFAHTDPAVQNPLINAIEILAPSRLRVVSAGADASQNGQLLQQAVTEVAAYPKGEGNEWIIKIEAGTYALSETLRLHPYVEIEGSGKDQTTVSRSIGTYAVGTEFIDSAVVYGADKAVIRQVEIEVSGGYWSSASYGILSVRGAPRFEAISIELYGGSHTGVRVSGGRPHLRDIAVTTPQMGGYVTGLEILDSQPRVGNVTLSIAASQAGRATGVRVSGSNLEVSHTRIRTDNVKWGSTGFSCLDSVIRLKDVSIEAFGSASAGAFSASSCDAELDSVHATTSGGWGAGNRYSGGSFSSSESTITNSSFTALGHSAHMVALTASGSTVHLRNTELHAASTGTPVYGAWITDSDVTMIAVSLAATDGDPPFLMTVNGSSVTITDSNIRSFEDTYSTGRGIVVEDGALPVNLVIEGTTVLAPDWIVTNNSTGTVTFRNSTLDGGPRLGSGTVICLNVWDEHGTFYPNTCPD